MQYRIISNQRSGADLKFRRKGGRLLFSYTLSAIVEAQKVIKQSGNKKQFFRVFLLFKKMREDGGDASSRGALV